MGQKQAYEQYQRTQVETASPAQLILMLYDGALRFCAKGRDAMLAGRIEEQNTNLIRVQKIIGELMSSLDRKTGGEVAGNLFKLYTYMLERLVTANLQDNLKMVDEVASLLRDLRDAWFHVESTGEPADASAASMPQASLQPAPSPGAVTAAQKPAAVEGLSPSGMPAPNFRAARAARAMSANPSVTQQNVRLTGRLGDCDA